MNEYSDGTTELTFDEILNTKFYCSDLREKVSIRQYLSTLLETLWTEEEGFSGKRPFGNSGWQHDLYRPLVKIGVVWGTFEDESEDDGYGEEGWSFLEDFDRKTADSLVLKLIKYMCGTSRGNAKAVAKVVS